MQKPSQIMPLHSVCNHLNTDEIKHEETVKIAKALYQKINGISNEYLNVKNSYGYAPLHLAIKNNNIKLVKFLIETRETNLELTGGPFSNSPIHFVAQVGNVEILNLFQNQGNHSPESDQNRANLLAKNSRNENALHIAVLFRKDKIFEILLKIPGFKIGDCNIENLNLLHLCAQETNIESFKYLLSLIDKKLIWKSESSKSNNILHIATQNNNFEFVVEALKLLKGYLTNKDINEKLIFAKNNLGQTCFHIAASVGNHTILNYLLKNYDEERLLGDKDNKLNTAFHLACLNQRENIVRFLLKFNLDSNAKNSDYLSVFDICCQRGNLEIVKLTNKIFTQKWRQFKL